jgi:hypothetical protein
MKTSRVSFPLRNPKSDPLVPRSEPPSRLLAVYEMNCIG